MSEIWNEFEKIAVEQGLIAEAQEDERTERPQEDSSKMPARYDSISNDAIRLLYGLKPETIFEKNKTIIEVAHPDTAVAGRAYDAMNAVWENEHQRHDMMAYIALKMPNGKLIQKRYVAAKQDLVNALVRSAFTLDNQDEYELMALADSCAERLNKRGEEVQEGFYKRALGPVAVTGIVAAVALQLGAAWYLFWGPQTAQSVYINAQQVLESLSNLSSQPYAGGIRTDVENLMRLAEDVYEVKDQLAEVRSVDEAITMAQSAEHRTTVEAINQRIHAYIAQLRKVQRAIPGWVAKIEAVHATSTEGSSDFLAKLKGIFGPFYDTDAEDLIEKLYGQKAWMGLGEGRSGGLYEAINKDIEVMTKIMAAARQEVQQKIPQLETPEAPAPAPAPKAEMPIAQAPVQLPPPTPAPAPTAPGGAAAARQRPEGFAGLPEW